MATVQVLSRSRRMRPKWIDGGRKCCIRSEGHCHPLLGEQTWDWCWGALFSLFQIVGCSIHDIQDHYRIIVFEGSESLNNGTPLKSHLTLPDGPYRPSDRFLRLHFSQCLAVSVCRGDVIEDYREQEIDNFMEELGVYDGEINTGDPRWSTPLGSHVHAYLIRQKMAE